eukprot:6671793-Alexandrium_andersonii.AAC.1
MLMSQTCHYIAHTDDVMLGLDATFNLDEKNLVFMCPGPLALHHEHNRVVVRFMPGLCVKAHKEDTTAYAMAIDLLMQE